jgi:NADH-quinone oxidoreductase subunit M
MICHGISTGALFILVGSLQERLHTRDMNRMGGLWSDAPRMAGVGLVFALASLGQPGMGNFVGEFLVLIGSYRVNVAMAALATIGLVAATVYSLWIIQRVFHGQKREDRRLLADLSAREMIIMTVMIIAIVLLGMYPQPLFNTVAPALASLERNTSATQGANENKPIIRPVTDTGENHERY